MDLTARVAAASRRNAQLAALGAAILALPVAGALANAGATAPSSAESLTAGEIEQARQLFGDLSCGACHSLADAGAAGQLGPSLDGDVALDHGLAVMRITEGKAMMPAYAGQLSAEEIDLLARYIMQAKT